MNIENKIKWYDKGWFLWVLLIFFPIVGIPFMWIKKKEFTIKKKVILSVIFALWLFSAIAIGNPSSNIETSNSTTNSD